MSASVSSSERYRTPTENDKYSVDHDKYLGLDASSEHASSDAPETPAVSNSSKAASRIIRNRKEQTKSLPPRPSADEAHSVASNVTEAINHASTTTQTTSGSGGPEKTASNSSAASQTAVRSFRRLRANRQRVPGGAAAKLFGKSNDTVPGPVADDDGDGDGDGDGDDALEVKPPLDELDRIRQEALAEYSKGPKTNRRYHASDNDMSNVRRGLERSPNEASLPSILNRTEIFHENATAAVLSLLNPPMSPNDQKDASALVTSHSNDITQVPLSPLASNNLFMPPQKEDDDASSVGAVKNPKKTSELTSSGKIQLQQPLLTRNAELQVEQIAEKMFSPNKQLGDLMAAIRSPENGDFSRRYMVRRKNACGALQVLTANSIHRVRICWTLGVLPSITSVLEDAGSRDLESVFPDKDTRREYIEARTRAIKALMNLSMPPDNRLAVFHSPRLVSALIHVINQEPGECRKGCCAILAHLAKTKENRILLAQVPGLLDAATDVIQPIARPPPLEDDVESVRSQEQDPLESMSSSDNSAGAPAIVESFMSEEELEKKEYDKVTVSKVHTDESEDPIASSRRYDSDPNTHLHGARQNIFAFLGHLLKEKDNAVSFL
jgi:hypothetical protein